MRYEVVVTMPARADRVEAVLGEASKVFLEQAHAIGNVEAEVLPAGGPIGVTICASEKLGQVLQVRPIGGVSDGGEEVEVSFLLAEPLSDGIAYAMTEGRRATLRVKDGDLPAGVKGRLHLPVARRDLSAALSLLYGACQGLALSGQKKVRMLMWNGRDAEVSSELGPVCGIGDMNGVLTLWVEPQTEAVSWIAYLLDQLRELVAWGVEERMRAEADAQWQEQMAHE